MDKSLTATLKYALSSEQKMELVAKSVRWKDVNEAMSYLRFMPKKAAGTLLKVLKSAVANAKNNAGITSEDSLYIKRIDVGKWPKLKRMSFVSRAWVHPYEKHRAFVRVVLDTK